MLVSLRRIAVLLAAVVFVMPGVAWGQGPAQGPAGPMGPAVPQAQQFPAPRVQPPRGPQQPPWWPQMPEHQKYVADILKYWEQSSTKIERYRCQFTRWEYDPVWGPKPDQNGKRPAARISYGEIKYARPDKGLYHVKQLKHYTLPKTPGDPPQYQARDGEVGEHWVCNGKSIFEFVHDKKKLVEHQLPPQMQGQAIVDGPLPFLFGANAEKIQQRYWVGVFTPPTAKGEYWLEAWPKFREDAQNYRKVEIIIAEVDFLPKAIQIYDHNGNDRDPSSTVLTFENREINYSLGLGRLDPLEVGRIIMRDFHEPTTPFGWKKEVVRFDAAGGNNPPAPPAGRQAVRLLPQIPLRKE